MARAGSESREVRIAGWTARWMSAREGVQEVACWEGYGRRSFYMGGGVDGAKGMWQRQRERLESGRGGLQR